MGTSGQAHVVVYNTNKLSEDNLPDTILGFTDPVWHGRIGWHPNNRTLQEVITALRQLEGDAKNVAAKSYPGDPGGLIGMAGVGIIKGTGFSREKRLRLSVSFSST